jgi:orotate phosphoribosyltransferase
MKIASLLLNEKAVSLEPSKPFRYASGILSPIYCDNRILLTSPDSRKEITDSFINIIKKNDLQFDVICGVATAGIVWGALIAEKLGSKFIYVRSEKKDHGKQSAIEGKLENGQRILVIEDLVSTGGSSIKAIENIREAGGIVNDCLAIFSYGMQKAEQSFLENKCNLITITNLTELLDYAVDSANISEKQKDIILEWIKEPATWGKTHGFE